MTPVVLEYHDVIDRGAPDRSGFPGGAAATYKLEASLFQAHLSALAAVPVAGGTAGASGPAGTVWFTFDDGGISALRIADALEAFGWRGHFLMATDVMGTAGFCAAPDLQQLHQRGHVVGSHSCSHPLRMSACTDAELRREWRDSIARLADVLGTAPTVASVPGGGYSTRVARFAAEAGITTLFTSEPTVRVHAVAGCTVHGRYTLRDSSPALEAVALATGRGMARTRQWTWWNSKKAAKAIGGPVYLRLRELLMSGRSQ